MKNFVIVFILFTQSLMSQKVQILSFNQNWHFQPIQSISPPKKEDLGQNLNPTGYDTHLPNTVLNALFENKAIDDPHYRDNETRLQWLEKTDWVFTKTFDIEDTLLKQEKIELQLRGVDTYAAIFLNDSLLLKTDNYFRTWVLDIKNYLKPTNNVLKIEFTSPVTIEKKKLKDSPIDFPDVYGTTRVYTRKPQFHYGWDWGPRFVSCGIQDIKLVAWSDARLTDVFIKQDSISKDLALLTAIITIESTSEKNIFTQIKISDHVFFEQFKTNIGLNTFEINIPLDTPQLWWTHQLGEPFLYDVKCSLSMPYGGSTEGVILDEMVVKVGLREIKLVTKKDEKGETFYFTLNGLPVFIKGANYIPQSLFQERVKYENYEKLIESTVKGNMNMLRIWGGGIYEDKAFYDLCDEKGVLVWQDFMYACAMYPGDDSFLQNAENEAVEQVIRLRNHPSIALWCGNNEINEAWHNWGWQPRFNPDQKEYIWGAYKRLFMDILPQAVRAHSNHTDYWESSPRYGRYDKRSYTEGDNHDWYVWHDEKPFEHFEEKIPRFGSEFGFQSFPEWKTIESFTLPEERVLESKVMLLHQRHMRGNQMIKKYMERDYNLPYDFENFVYVSQILQAEGIGKAIEAQRRAKPYNMGTLYWQLNDVWQVASWSGMDNFGRWKALHYTIRDVYADVLISPIVQKNDFKIFIVNDLYQLFQGDLIIKIMDLKGKIVFEKTVPIALKGNSSDVYFNMVLKDIFKNGIKKEEVVAHMTFKFQNDKPPIEKTFYFAKPRDLTLELGKISRDVIGQEGGVLIKIQSPVLLKNVLMSSPTEGVFQENYFDLLPNIEKTIFYKTDEKAENVSETLRIKSLVNTY
jgi:beta-mannosidase